jgi:hypothetical protein
MSDRGIVICAGGIKYLPSAWVLIRLLRFLNCHLPIEVWHLGNVELDNRWRTLIRPYGVSCIDATLIRETCPHPRLMGWELKPYAMLHSALAEVLLLDADNVPVRDPSYLFDDLTYRSVGAVFWPDGCRTPIDSPRWDLFGVPYRDEPEQESGQILVNKHKCLEALQLCNWYNERSDYYYQFVYGDKDTFRFAWHKVGMPFSMPERGIEVIPCTLCQHDLSGRRIFQHRVHAKWSLINNRRIPGFIHEDKCLQFIDELNQIWKPITLLTQHLTSRDFEAAAELVGRKYRLIWSGRNKWDIELALDGRVTKGFNANAFFWWIDDGDMCLAGADGAQWAKLASNGVGWSGTTVQRRQKVTLEPSRQTQFAVI